MGRSAEKTADHSRRRAIDVSLSLIKNRERIRDLKEPYREAGRKLNKSSEQSYRKEKKIKTIIMTDN